MSDGDSISANIVSFLIWPKACGSVGAVGPMPTTDAAGGKIVHYIKECPMNPEGGDTKNARMKIKADATKVLARLAGPRADMETCMESGEWENVPRFVKLKVDNYLTELTAMHDEAKGKFSDREPIPLSFDMSTLNKIVSDGKLIMKSVKEFAQTRTTETCTGLSGACINLPE